MEPLDVRNLVIYETPPRDDEDDEVKPKLVGVKEFHVAKALMEGRQEELSQLLPSQCGMVHLFDLCLRFGLNDTASALAKRDVPGCILEDHHNLGPFSRDSSFRHCNCQGYDTCRRCCWAFPVEQGIWMEDWNVTTVDLFGAIPAAQKAAAKPLTRAMLDLSSCDGELPFSGSPKTMARLLDIAILTGNQKAAVNLSKKSHLRPLRRWGMDWKFEECWQAARTALWAGANFQDLMVKDRFDREDVPFPQALFLKSLEDWQKTRHLLPKCHGLWRPRNVDNQLGQFFLERPHGPDGGRKLSLDKIRAAEDAGVDLQFLFVEVWCAHDATYATVTLLDMAIWYGQPDCAEACVDGGIELKGDGTLAWHQRVLRGESPSLQYPILDVVPSEAQIAAAAAGRASLKRSWHSESSRKGIVLYQMMVKMFKGRSFPMSLVQEISAFSMPVPKIIDQLHLWEHVGDWMATICGRPPPSVASSVGVALGSAGSQISSRGGWDGTDQEPSHICNKSQPKRKKVGPLFQPDARSRCADGGGERSFAKPRDGFADRFQC